MVVATSFMAMLEGLVNVVAGEPLVVTVNPQPPAKVPELKIVSSTIYRLQFPFGSVPLKAIEKVNPPSGGAER